MIGVTGIVLSFTGCLTAALLVWRYRREPESAPIVTDMHTHEFVALHEAVIAEHARRTGDLQLAAA